MIRQQPLIFTLAIIVTIFSCNNSPSSFENTRPTANFTVNPESGNTGTIFAFNANSSYDEEDETAELQVRWDWENDGVWDTDYSTIKTETHQFLVDGTYMTALEVMDTGELSNAFTLTITVTKQNTAPTASFSVSPSTGSVNDVFNFDASSSHDKEDETTELQVRWDWENDGTWDTDYNTVKTATHQFTIEGNYTTRLEVKDSEDWLNRTTREITVQRESIVVTIADANLEALLRLTLNNFDEEITDIELESIIYLNGNGWNISDISGIEYCLSLQKLDLRNNNINNIDPLNSSINLQNLTLSNNHLNEINSLSGLSNLQVLGLYGNAINNIEPLNNLSNLILLFLGDNQIVNINPLANLVNLKDLGLADNQIVDIYPLILNSGINNGDIITLTGNPLSEISVNTYIPQLEGLGVTIHY